MNRRLLIGIATVGLGALLICGAILAMSRLNRPTNPADDPETPNVLKRHTAAVRSVAFSPDGKLLASGSHDKTVRLWDTATWKERKSLTGHTASVSSVAFTPDGKMLASGGADAVIKLWEVDTGKERATFQVPPAKGKGSVASVSSVVFTPDGKILAATVDWRRGEGGPGRGQVMLWDVDTGKELSTFQGDFSSVSSVAFMPDGKTLALKNGGKVTLWDVATGKEQASLKKTDRAAVGSLAIAPGGKTLAVGERKIDRTGSGKDLPCDVTLWDTTTAKEIAIFTVRL